MAIAPECQPIADALAALQAQEQVKLGDVPGLAGVDRWRAIQDLGVIRQQIAEQQAKLDVCQAQHVGDLPIEVVVFDLPGDSGPNRIARLWRMTPPEQSVKQTASVTAGATAVTIPTGDDRQRFGLTIEETDHPTVNGPDFRSGPLPGQAINAADPAGRIEIVILDPFSFEVELVSRAAPPLPLTLSLTAAPIGAIQIQVSRLDWSAVGGMLLVTVTGTTTAPFMSSPFTLQANFHIAPSFAMTPSLALEVALVAPPRLDMTGMIGGLSATIADFLSANLLAPLTRPVASALNTTILKQTATNLGLAAVPSGSVLSVRQLTLDNMTLTVWPALAAFGTVLSNFQPPPSVVAARLAGLTVNPTSIGTSDPANRTAQGQVTLTDAAPAGGLTVLLSVDQPDVAQVVPALIAVAEGDLGGTFTVSGLAQPLGGPDHRDVTVRASLGDQTLAATLTVRPEPPATPPPSPDVAAVAPETAQMERDVVDGLNWQRTQILGRSPLVWSDQWGDLARARSIDMALGRAPFQPEGVNAPWAQAGASAEILGQCAGRDVTPVVAGWFNGTDLQKLVVTQDYGATGRVGVGVAKSPQGLYYITAIFAVR